ncbi:unnamed protein product, partial [Rotaria sp. Silwood2]
MNIHDNQELSSIIHANRYLLKFFHRIRNRFYHAKIKDSRISINLQSNLEIFTSSSLITDYDFGVW